LIGFAAPDEEVVDVANGVAFSMGMGIVALGENRLDRDADGLFGIPMEISMVQHDHRVWLGAGLSWMFGTSAIATDSRNVNAHIFGLHGDLACSVLAFAYADFKLGIGAALRYASVEREDWSGGYWETSDRFYPGGHQNKFLANGRFFASLLLHSPGGSGGLELIPLRIEYGPSMAKFAPALSFSKFL
jgi:hypothetical protein